MKRALIDHVEFAVQAGNGGNGAVSFRREKFIPKGGPDGGDGGNGGSIYLVTNPHMTTLMDYAGKVRFEAVSGGRGLGRKMHGKDAPNLKLEVPVGTVIWEKRANQPTKLAGQFDPQDFKSLAKAQRLARNQQIKRGEYEWVKLADLDQPDMKFLVAQGGKGGLGNDHFKSSVNTTPRYAEPGEYGEEKHLKLEMKILADAGLVGLPNAGKSTLLSVLTAAKPEIDNYPFTTITPNLGVMETKEHHQLIVADIPGLIEDAHKGKGLGIEFLRHIERCKALIYVISPTEEDLMQFSSESLVRQYEVVRNEVKSYGQGVDAKPIMVVINKIDVLSKAQVDETVKAFTAAGETVTPVSAATGVGIEMLKSHIAASIL